MGSRLLRIILWILVIFLLYPVTLATLASLAQTDSNWNEPIATFFATFRNWVDKAFYFADWSPSVKLFLTLFIAIIIDIKILAYLVHDTSLLRIAISGPGVLDRLMAREGAYDASISTGGGLWVYNPGSEGEASGLEVLMNFILIPLALFGAYTIASSFGLPLAILIFIISGIIIYFLGMIVIYIIFSVLFFVTRFTMFFTALVGGYFLLQYINNNLLAP